VRGREQLQPYSVTFRFLPMINKTFFWYDKCLHNTDLVSERSALVTFFVSVEIRQMYGFTKNVPSQGCQLDDIHWLLSSP